MMYYIISTTYQKTGDLVCPVHCSGLLHSVKGMLLQKLFHYIMLPSEGIVIKTPQARIWNVLAANFSQEKNPQVSTNKIGGISDSVSQRKCSENTTIFSTLIKGMPRRHVKKNEWSSF